MEYQKSDKGKLPMYTVMFKQFPRALEEVAKGSAAGHAKYPNDTDWLNFSRVDNPERYLEAAVRHLLECSKGEDIMIPDLSLESFGFNTKHIAQVAWNLLAFLETTIRNGESKDNLPR